MKSTEKNRGVPGAELPLSPQTQPGGEQGVGSAVVREWMEPWLVRGRCGTVVGFLRCGGFTGFLMGLNGIYIDVIM